MRANPKQTKTLDDLFEACDPVDRRTITTASVAEALDELGSLIASRPPSTRHTARRWQIRRPRTAFLVAATILATAGAVTAGTVMTAHTGHLPTKAEEQMGGPGEGLNPAAPDFPDVAVEAAADIPYPPGYLSWRDFVLEQVPSGDEAENTEISTGALRGWYAASAYCAWVQAWRTADVTGATSAAQEAAQVIKQAPGWKAVRDEDPHPDPHAANDPGAASGTIFGWMLPYRDAVLAGDRARVEQLLATGYGDGKCWLSDPAWMARQDAWATLSPKERAEKYLEYLARARS
jgi:hypothetical protein